MKYGILFEGERYEDVVFDTEAEAEDFAGYLSGCAQLGAETLNMSNMGDNPYDEDTWEPPVIEVIELDE